MRNPYNPTAITRYELNPGVVDMIGFCTKNPEPMLKYTELLTFYGQFWFVTITPYGTDIESDVPPAPSVIETFKKRSLLVGIHSIGWRYDPIFINKYWSVDRHIRAFSEMAASLSGYTETCIISFIDLYEKVRRNFPEVRAVSWDDQIRLTESFVTIGKRYGISINPCGESKRLESVGA